MINQTTQGAVVVLAIDTPLDAEAGSLLADRVAALPRGGRPQLVIDMSGVPLIDSAGCEALLDIGDAVGDVGGAANLACPAPLCSDVLHATGVADHFELFETVNEAVANFAR